MLGHRAGDGRFDFAVCGRHPVFVVDAYTETHLGAARLDRREGAKYEDVRWMFERQFPGNAETFNEFHGLIVPVGKKWCRKSVALIARIARSGRYKEEGR